MKLTARQQWVFDNLERVVSDGARCDTRYELENQNVSLQMRGLLRQGVVALDDAGRASRRHVAAPVAATANHAVIDDLRLLLLGESGAPVDAARTPVDASDR